MAKIGDTERSGKTRKTAEFKRRFYDLALSTVRFIDGLPNDTVTRRMADQLLRSATSVVANYVEGQSAGTRKDFANFLNIALKSANESKVWFALLRDSQRADRTKVNAFLQELDEIARILGASIVTLRRKKE
jgi:four helix bundle protein